MPVTPTSPSIAAFVGYTARGLDNRATRIFSYADFERDFGGLAADSELSYSVQHFFNNGGSDAWIVRIPKVGANGSVLPGTADLIGSPALSTGMYALDKVDLFNVLVIPEATRAQASNPAKTGCQHRSERHLRRRHELREEAPGVPDYRPAA
jgi:hypothetical protein